MPVSEEQRALVSYIKSLGLGPETARLDGDALASHFYPLRAVLIARGYWGHDNEARAHLSWMDANLRPTSAFTGHFFHPGINAEAARHIDLLAASRPEALNGCLLPHLVKVVPTPAQHAPLKQADDVLQKIGSVIPAIEKIVPEAAREKIGAYFTQAATEKSSEVVVRANAELLPDPLAMILVDTLHAKFNAAAEREAVYENMMERLEDTARDAAARLKHISYHDIISIPGDRIADPQRIDGAMQIPLLLRPHDVAALNRALEIPRPITQAPWGASFIRAVNGFQQAEGWMMALPGMREHAITKPAQTQHSRLVA